MEQYLKYDTVSLEEMLAACKDFKERQNIRSALRELKGLKLDGNEVITYSFGSNSVKRPSSITSPRQNQQRQKSTAISLKDSENVIKTKTSENSKVLHSTEYGKLKGDDNQSLLKENSSESCSLNNEQGKDKPKYRSYLNVGNISSPKTSPRSKKDARSPRKVHTAITRIKVLDKADLVDKSTETEEGHIVAKAEPRVPKTASELDFNEKLSNIKRRDRVERYESTPKPRSAEQSKQEKLACEENCAIEFSDDINKVKTTSVLHRPVSVNLSSLKSDSSKENLKSPRSNITPPFSSPRKPRKIVSYRTSAFSPTNKLSPVSSTVSRSRLQSAPGNVENLSDYSGSKDAQGFVRHASDSSSQSSDRTHITQGIEVADLCGVCGDTISDIISGNLKVIKVDEISKRFENSKEFEGPSVKPNYSAKLVQVDSFSNLTDSAKKEVEKSSKSNTTKDTYTVENGNTHVELASKPPSAKELSKKKNKEHLKSERIFTEKSSHTQENIYSAKPVEIIQKPESKHENLVIRLRNKLDSKKKRDFKTDLQEFTFFTNTMKEKHVNKLKSEDKTIVLSPVKTEPDVQLGENEVKHGTNVISNYTNNKAMTMEEHGDISMYKKKVGLSRKNRIDSDEHKNYRKYKKKAKDGEKKHEIQGENVSKLDLTADARNTPGDASPRKINKEISGRRKLPEIPVKQDTDPEDDETVHQRTIRLLQERRKERRSFSEKDVCNDKTEKSKVTPTDLKKSLEKKVQRSDSKKKAIRARRELQLLNLEKELKSNSGNKSDSDSEVREINEHLDKGIRDPLFNKYSVKDSNRRPVQRSQSDNVRRRRTVSETDSIIDAPGDKVDGRNEESSVLNMFEVQEPLTPAGKIELIGNLMQEEAKLQEMLRKSTSFSEKRKMRAEVRQLRQKRMAVEGTEEAPPTCSLQRSVSVTSGVITHATPVFIRPASTVEVVADKKPSQSVSSIEELRKQLSETQDYEEKKKIRLALRQLRQQSREGPQTGLQRSQSFIQQKSSEPVTNGINQLNGPITRSRSVTEQRIPHSETVKPERKSRTDDRVINGDVSLTEKEKLKHSRLPLNETKPPIPNAVQKHSSLNNNRHIETVDSQEKLSGERNNSNDLNVKKHLGKEISDKTGDINREGKEEEKTFEGVRYRKKERSVKTDDFVNNKELSPRRARRSQSYNGRDRQRLTQNENINDGRNKSVELLKETVKKLENQKKNRVLEKCELFENADKNKTEKNILKELDTDKGNTKASHILVSRADVEKNKQNKLISLRTDRSISEPKINNQQEDLKLNYRKESEQITNNTIIEITPKVKIYESLKTDNKVVSNSAEKDSVKDKLDIEKDDIRFSPSLLWLEEKRKSLTPSSDIEKLLSTMDIEAAFSEILDAVEEFPDQKQTMEAPTADTPILEEETCESSEVEEENNKRNSMEINGRKKEGSTSVSDKENSVDERNVNKLFREKVTNGPLNKDNSYQDSQEQNCESVSDKSGGNGLANGESAINQMSGLHKSEAKLKLSSNLSLDISSPADNNSAISVIHGDDGTVTVQEVNRIEDGDTTITEWKKLRRTQSRTETRETDTIVEKKITSPGGSSTVYEKDVSKTKHKLTSRGSNYFTKNNYNIKRRKDIEGQEFVEHDLSSVSENMSVSKNESWGNKSAAKVVVAKDDLEGSPLKAIADHIALKEIEAKKGVPSLVEDKVSSSLSVLHSHLGRPSGCPEVTSTLKEISAIQGSSVILECTVVSSSSLTVTWYRGDNEISSSDDDVAMEFDTDSGKATLTIKSAAVEDLGEYKCVFTNTLGTATTKGRLLVTEITSSLPCFVTELSDVTVQEGQSLCLECQVTNTETVTWCKDGIIQRNSADFKQSFDGSKAKLEIVEIFVDDFGTYSCILKNSNGEQRSSCKVTVKEAASSDEVYPIFLKKPETMIANEKDPVIIDCEVIGTPQPEITWLCDGSQVAEDSRHRMSYDGRVAMLVIRRVTVEDGGKIQCIAQNTSGKVIADCMLVVKALKSPPKVTRPLSDITFNSGQNAILECMVSGEPTPEISWRKNGLIIGQVLDFMQTFSNGVAKLEICDVCTQDAGCYECVAINEKGQASTSCQLTVTEETVPVEASTMIERPKPTITVNKETPQTVSFKTFKSSFVADLDTDLRHPAKSQASKVMLVRQGSLRSLNKENLDKPMVRTGSLQSIDTSGKFDIPRKSININVTEPNDIVQHTVESDVLTVKSDHEKEVDLNKNYLTNANISKTSNTDVVKNDNGFKSEVDDSPSLESPGVKEVKPLVNFKAGGEIRRSQSVKTPGSEKPEWLQVKLRKVGCKPSPLTFENKKPLPQSEPDSTAETKISSNNETKISSNNETKISSNNETKISSNNETKISSNFETKNSSNLETAVHKDLLSVQREVKLSRSHSARIVDRSRSPGLRDSTNSPLNQPNRDSAKTTPVSERAKIFQMLDTDSSSSTSGKSSPVEIISKAINLSRADSLRSPVAQRAIGVQRSHSFKMEAKASSQGDVTLELTPQKTKGQDEKSEPGGSRKVIKYWDPTAPPSTTMDYSTIDDEEKLSEMLSKSDNFDERKKLRARIKEVRDAHMKEWEAKRAARETDHEDLIKKKHREADALKQQKLDQFQKQAAEHTEAKHLDVAEQHLRERMKLADETKKRQMEEFSGRGATHQESTHLEISERALQEKIKQADILKKKTLDSYDKAAGKPDGSTVTTTRKTETVTKVGGASGKPADEIAPQLAQQIIKAVGNVSGVLTVKTESWSSKDNITHTSEKTETWGGRGGAMNAFKAMDAQNAPKTNLAPGGGKANITRSPSAIKTMLLEWTKAMTREYADKIVIENFSTSWNDGIAFCALIHHFYPDSFDFYSLDPKNRRQNFELAFDTAEKLADIAPLLDVEDMVRMQKPDWKCVFTYVQSFYRKLNSHERNKAMA